jgi:hypothetical protein
LSSSTQGQTNHADPVREFFAVALSRHTRAARPSGHRSTSTPTIYTPAVEDYVASYAGSHRVDERRQVLAESHSLVEQGAITEADFKAWVFDNP